MSLLGTVQLDLVDVVVNAGGSDESMGVSISVELASRSRVVRSRRTADSGPTGVSELTFSTGSAKSGSSGSIFDKWHCDE